LMRFDCSDQQTLIARPFVENLVMGDDLVFGLLQLHQLAKFIRLTRFDFANDFGVRLKQTDYLFWKLGHSSKEARSGLTDYTVHSLCDRLQLLRNAAHFFPSAAWHRFHFLQHAARIIQDPPRQIKQLLIFCLAFVFPFRSLVTQSVCDRYDSLRYTAHPVANSSFQAAYFLLDLWEVIERNANRSKTDLRFEIEFLSLIALGWIFTQRAHAAAGGNLPWEAPLTAIAISLTGPVAYAVGLIGIAIAGGTMLWGGELSEFGRRACMIGLVVSVLVFAAPLLSSAFGVNAAVV
jgi:type IV secretion system protein TrbC